MKLPTASLAPLVAATLLLGMSASYAQTTATYDWSTATASAAGTPLNTDSGRISGANDGWGHSSVAGNLSVKSTHQPAGFSGNYVDTGTSDSSARRHNNSQFAYSIPSSATHVKLSVVLNVGSGTKIAWMGLSNPDKKSFRIGFFDGNWVFRGNDDEIISFAATGTSAVGAFPKSYRVTTVIDTAANTLDYTVENLSDGGCIMLADDLAIADVDWSAYDRLYLRGNYAKLDDFTVSFIIESSPVQSLELPRVTEQAERNNEPTNAEEAAAQRKADANLSLEEKYQAHVATLTPEQQAWEVVLQENLGGFYLPIHQKEKIAGKSNAWDFVQDDPQLPRVLLIGDSVSRAYTSGVRELLAGKANVHRAPANCGPSATGLKKIDLWLGDGNWDLILFNFGIHDRSTPLDAYSERLDELVKIMKRTGANITWATTTPIPDMAKTGQTAASVVERNEAAAKVMAKHSIPSVDLFTYITPHLETVRRTNDVHFHPEGYQMLSEAVAAFIEKEL